MIIPFKICGPAEDILRALTLGDVFLQDDLKLLRQMRAEVINQNHFDAAIEMYEAMLAAQPAVVKFMKMQTDEIHRIRSAGQN